MLQRIGRYEILDRVASGGQGTVYRARDTVLDRVVAVKVINQSIEDDPAYLEALQREARLAAGLDHPNITRVHDFQVEDGTPYIVMEYVPDALDRHLQNGSSLPWQRATEIAVEVARGLQHAHDNGVVHRDIKPQNILLREDGSVSVSDFGIARALASSSRSRTASVMGTPAYMAPEQWASGTLDGRLDQYALGIVFYEMLTGTAPFQGESMEAMYVQHREAPVPPISSSLQVPDGVESVIRRTLEKSPGDRYRSASELADALEGALTSGAVQGPGIDEVSPSPGRESPRPAPAAAAPPPRPPQPPAPPRQPAASGSGSGRIAGMPRRLLFGGLGAAVIAVIAIVVALSVGGNGGNGKTVQVFIPADTPEPTVTPMPTYTPYPTPTPRPTYTPPPTPTARVIVVAPTFTPRPTPTKTPRPTATPNAWSYYNKGKEYHNAENWVMAVGEYTKAIQANPNYTDAYFYRGYSYQKLDQDQNAINDYTKAIQFDPDYATAYNNRGYSYFKLEQYQTAIDDYTKAIQLDPDDANAYNNRGYSYGELGQHQNAINDYTKVIQLDPDDANAYHNRAIAYQWIDDHERAVDDYSKLLQIDPSDPDTWIARGDVYMDLKLRDLAISDYDSAISLDPESADAYYSRGYAYHWLSSWGDSAVQKQWNISQNEQAVRDLTKAIELSPDFAGAYWVRSGAYDWLMESTGNLEYYRAMVADTSKACSLDSRYC